MTSTTCQDLLVPVPLQIRCGRPNAVNTRVHEGVASVTLVKDRASGDGVH